RWALGAATRRWPPRGSAGPARGRCREVSELVDRLGERRLLVGGLVGLDGALAGGLVELTRGGDEQCAGLLLVARRGGLAQCPDGRPQRGLDRLVAQTVALVLVVPLDLGLDVGHSSHLRVMCQRSTD